MIYEILVYMALWFLGYHIAMLIIGGTIAIMDWISRGRS